MIYLGRVGQGDSILLHKWMFDNDGPVAYHAATHDAFGYLYRTYNVGPGYNYLHKCSIFNTYNPLSGHFSGLKYWSKILDDSEINDGPIFK